MFGILTVAPLLLAACSPDSVIREVAPTDGLVAFETLGQGSSSYSRRGTDEVFPDPQVLVVLDEPMWLSFWERHTRGHFPPPPAPSIDFAKQTVLVLVDTIEPGVSWIRVDSVRRESGRLIVEGTRKIACWLPAESQPYHIVAIARCPCPAELQLLDLENDCS